MGLEQGASKGAGRSQRSVCGSRGVCNALLVLKSCFFEQNVLEVEGCGSDGGTHLLPPCSLDVIQGDHVTFLNVYQAFLNSKMSGQWCHQNCINYQAMVCNCLAHVVHE